MPFDKDHRYSSSGARRTFRQWRWRRKRARAQRAELRHRLDDVRSRINACHAVEDVDVAPSHRPETRKTWVTLSLRDHLAAKTERRTRQSLGSLARAMREGSYSRAVHSRKVTGVLLAVLADSKPDDETVAGVGVILGEAITPTLEHELYYARLRGWLVPYFDDHADVRARLSAWLQSQRGDAGERSA